MMQYLLRFLTKVTDLTYAVLKTWDDNPYDNELRDRYLEQLGELLEEVDEAFYHCGVKKSFKR